jgi:uncharacterized protein
MNMGNVQIAISESELPDLCRRRGIRSVALFGSALREGFRPDSDVDILIDYEPGARHDLWDHYDVQKEFKNLFGRKTDVVTREALERSANWIRRRAILESAETIYVAR